MRGRCPRWWGGVLAGLMAWPVCAQEPASAPAPNQHRQPLYLTAHPSLFTIPDASNAFEKDVYPTPDFLPPGAYADPAEGTSPLDLEDEGGVQQIVYPTEDSSARDEDPVGHYDEPRWNPFPFLTEQLAAMPQEERGLICKEIAATNTVLPQVSDSYGMSTLDVRSTMYFGQLPIIQVTPRFGWHLISGGGPVGLPSQLYDAGIDTTFFLPLGQKWSFLGTVGPSIFTDGQNTSSDAFRMTGRALAFYQWSPTTKLAGGFLYLGRVDIKALPAGGIFYKPSDSVKAEIFFPKPKVAYRFRQNGDRESWCYLAGEFGGNSWAIQTDTGLDAQVTLRDYRLIAGIEHVAGEDYRWLVEAGFVFGRKIEYTQGLGNLTQSPTGLIRGGFVF